MREEETAHKLRWRFTVYLLKQGGGGSSSSSSSRGCVRRHPKILLCCDCKSSPSTKKNCDKLIFMTNPS